MGANSLLDIVVFGKACAENISELNKPGDTIDMVDLETMNNDIDNMEVCFFKLHLYLKESICNDC